MFDNDYKHPVVLAKEIATLDVLSGGRVEFGIGAGWMTTDYEQSGIPKDRDGVRIDRMVEALDVYRGAWAEGSFNFKGEHYTITRLRRSAEAAAAAAPADPHRRRRPEGAAHRGATGRHRRHQPAAHRRRGHRRGRAGRAAQRWSTRRCSG